MEQCSRIGEGVLDFRDFHLEIPLALEVQAVISCYFLKVRLEAFCLFKAGSCYISQASFEFVMSPGWPQTQDPPASAS
jgi:hypothetical protein